MLASDDAILLLIAILAEINTLATVFLPIASEPGGVQPTEICTGSPGFQDMFLPNSIHSSVRTARDKILKALISWENSYAHVVDKNVVPLLYYCRLFLDFPKLQDLQVLADYPPVIVSNPYTKPALKRCLLPELETGTEALRFAWLILDSTSAPTFTPTVWSSVVLFHAGLVVWAMISLKRQSGIHGSLQVLRLFGKELRTMNWPCSCSMAELLDSLAPLEF